MAKKSEKVDTFRTLARTEYQLLNAEAANDATEVERLRKQRPYHTVQIASDDSFFTRSKIGNETRQPST